MLKMVSAHSCYYGFWFGSVPVHVDEGAFVGTEYQNTLNIHIVIIPHAKKSHEGADGSLYF